MTLGIERERAVRRALEADEWFVIRTAGSKGVADLVALKPHHPPRLIEVKATTRSPWSGFPPADRVELMAAAAKAGGECWLVWWPKRKQATWIPAWAWPKVAAAEPPIVDDDPEEE